MLKYLVILFFPFLAFAQASHVSITVQSIECDGERGVNKRSKVVVHDSIRDLKPQLRQIPYKKFDLISSQNISMPVKTKQTLSFKNGDSLSLELLYLEKDRVGLWVDWKDADGMMLLNTQMHFARHETMLAGAENSSEQGKILAITIAD